MNFRKLLNMVLYKLRIYIKGILHPLNLSLYLFRAQVYFNFFFLAQENYSRTLRCPPLATTKTGLELMRASLATSFLIPHKFPKFFTS